MNNYGGDLSGGELKRLMIALELIDDPSILFLDEPTTGLDSFTSTKVMQLLKKLANEGRTIICSIHSPTASMFELFDHIYALADGHCIYQGSSTNLVPFLEELDLICPETYSPSDFLLEIANDDYGPQNNRLCEKIQNGRSSLYRSDRDAALTSCKLAPASSHSCYHKVSLFNQFQNLLKRNILISARDRTLSFMRIAIHLMVAIFIGEKN